MLLDRDWLTFQRQDRSELQEHAARGPPAWLDQRAAGRIRSFVFFFIVVAVAGIHGGELEGRIAEAVAICGRDLVLIEGRFALQAVVAGAAALWLLNPGELGELKGLLLFSLILETPFVLLDVHGRHSTEAARRAAHSILEGRRAPIYWVGVLGLGKLVPLLWISFLDTGSGLAVIPALLALLGIALWEHLWVEAPQRLPLA